MLGEALGADRATTSSWPRSSAWTCAAPTARTGACAGPGATSAGPSRRACAGCAPTTSTSTSCTRPTRHPDRGDARRAARAGPRGQGALRRQLQLHRLAGRRRGLDGARPAATSGSSAPRTSTPCSTATIEDELVPACERVGVGILPFFPLEFGLLTGKYRRGQEAPEGSRLAQESQPARARRVGPDRGGRGVRRRSAGCRMLHVAIGGLAAQPAVASVIAGVTRAEQVLPTPRPDCGCPRRRTSPSSTRSPAWSERRRAAGSSRAPGGRPAGFD